jgi:pimeloyl-ACP methyl ester carboxylesterase
VWTDALAGLVDMDLRHTLQHVAVPTLVVVGEHDRMTPPSAAVALAGDLPQGRLEVLERSGHFPMLEDPDRFNPRLRAFAREVLDRPPRTRRKQTA